MKEKAVDWANSMTNPTLSIKDIRESYRSQLILRLNYPMVILNAKDKNIKTILRPAMTNIIHSHHLTYTTEDDKSFIQDIYGGHGANDMETNIKPTQL